MKFLLWRGVDRREIRGRGGIPPDAFPVRELLGPEFSLRLIEILGCSRKCFGSVEGRDDEAVFPLVDDPVLRILLAVHEGVVQAERNALEWIGRELGCHERHHNAPNPIMEEAWSTVRGSSPVMTALQAAAFPFRQRCMVAGP